jgi:hypothetical protein
MPGMGGIPNMAGMQGMNSMQGMGSMQGMSSMNYSSLGSVPPAPAAGIYRALVFHHRASLINLHNS